MNILVKMCDYCLRRIENTEPEYYRLINIHEPDGQILECCYDCAPKRVSPNADH